MEVMSGSDRGLQLYNCMFHGNPLPNSVVNGLIRDLMLSKIIEKGFAVKVKRLDYYVPDIFKSHHKTTAF